MCGIREKEMRGINVLKWTGFVVFSLFLSTGTACSGSSIPAGQAIAEKGTIKLTFLGTGAPRPSLRRSGPGILVEAGPHLFLIDAGSGVREQIFRAGGWEWITGLSTILVTHLHYDHTVDITDLSLTGWMYGRRVPMEVYGPAGMEEMAHHFDAAYKWDKDMRRLVGIPMKGSNIVAHDIAPGVIFDKDSLKITAFEVEHMPINVQTGEKLEFYGQTLGYRIDYKGRSVVFSGDTRSTPASELNVFGKDVDVLVHEVQVPSPGSRRSHEWLCIRTSFRRTQQPVSSPKKPNHISMAVLSQLRIS